ncbi:response regulator [Azospirillum sp. TSH64]|uniref:PP2C family protein-serine/threonine phosphatase n=1 Tax=Azospirillum sp. TSH64 TaxID=652740 RepID=UPI000D643354|nr:response regulator [Azospirillum sp. TSH64]
MSGGSPVVIGHPRPSAAGPLRDVLGRLGVRRVAVVDGDGLAQAVAEATADPPQLLLLHAGLPGFGPDLLVGLREMAQLRDVPILVLGRFASGSRRAELMRAGATDLLARPLTLAELAARLSVHLERRRLDRSLQEVIRSLHAYHHGAMQRMALARQMQLGLLPDAAACRSLEGRYGIAMDSHFESSSELGGDLWGARPLDDRRFALFLCDFTGHGVAAALNTFRLHTLLARTDLPADDPAETLRTLNGLLVGLLPEAQFAAMIYAVVDVSADRLVYATAGAPKPLVRQRDGGLEVGPSCGLPLGLAGGARYRNHSLDFPPGSTLLLFSDALYEARGWDGEMFGYGGVTDLVRGLGDDELERPLDLMLDRYFATVPRLLADDLTVLWISRSVGPRSGPD